MSRYEVHYYTMSDGRNKAVFEAETSDEAVLKARKADECFDTLITVYLLPETVIQTAISEDDFPF